MAQGLSGGSVVGFLYGSSVLSEEQKQEVSGLATLAGGKETVTGNIAESQKGKNDGFTQHAGKEKEVNANLGKPPHDQIWTETNKKDPVSNAYGHWDKHKSEFPEFQNSKQYVDATHKAILVSLPPVNRRLLLMGEVRVRGRRHQ